MLYVGFFIIIIGKRGVCKEVFIVVKDLFKGWFQRGVNIHDSFIVLLMTFPNVVTGWIVSMFMVTNPGITIKKIIIKV